MKEMRLIFLSQVRTFVILSICQLGIALSPEDAILLHTAVLDPAENYHVFWNFDEKDIVFEVQVKTLGYVGFGLSPNGDMPQSDIVIGGVHDGDGTVYFTDRHAIRSEEPVVDVNQNWYLVRGSQNDTHTTLRFWRALDTCDDNDRPVQLETTRLIWAYQNEDADSSGAAKYHSVNRGSKSIFLLNPQKAVPDIPQDSLIVDFIHHEANVSDTHTTYWCEAFAIPEVDRKHHVIKFEPMVQPGHESLVHHIILFACFPPVTNETIGQSGICSNMPKAWQGCITTIFAWAIGGGPFYFPEHVGYPFGFDGDPSLILVQTHYDNPGLLKGVVDASGLRLTLSPRPRKYDAATLQTGVVVWKNHIIPPFAEKFRSDGHCVPDCLAQAMENHTTSINIFAGSLHSHVLGTALRFRHFRDGVEQRKVLEDNNYDFNFQETRMLNEEVTVLSGDHLVTECDYRTIHKNETTHGGESTNEEMCLTFALYYPRIPMSLCASTVDPLYMANFANATLYLNLTVKSPEEFEGTSVADFMSGQVDWTDKATRERFQKYSTTYDKPVRAFCLGTGKDSIYFKKVLLPEVKVKLPMDRGCVRLPDDATTTSPTDGATTTSPTDGATTTTHNVLVFFVYLTVSLLIEQMM